MEQNTSILSSLVQGDPLSKKTNGGSLLQAEEISAQFGEIMGNALQATQTQLLGEAPLALEQNTALYSLEQQITELSAETEGILIDADPAAVDDILADAVTQLWGLIENFDIRNETQYVSEISTHLAKAVSDTPATPNAVQLLSAAFTQPTNVLTAGTVVVANAPIETGRETLQSLVFLQPQAPTRDASLFANVSNLLQTLQPSTQNAQSLSAASQAVPNMSALDSTELMPKAISDWAQNIQQLTVEAPLKGSTLESTVAGQVVTELSGANNVVNASTLQQPAQGSVKAKVKDLLTFSAQSIASSPNAPVSTDDIFNLLPQTRSELQNVSITALPEQARPAKSFSQNVASQLQGKLSSEGITRIELAPRGLGNILIELQTKETGEIQIIVKAENPAVLHALRTDRDALLSALPNNISAQDGIDLEFEEFNEGQFDRDKDTLNLMDQVAQSENEDVEDSTNPASISRQILGAGRLDILT
ncbi:MAG: hypothetical protein COB84_07085 [Rhodobacteraceae bacterium]|nr:MAG: hypothetical protein COB84_07085 [Paracoccaceae bacterium]